jgi:hypothetical protein
MTCSICGERGHNGRTCSEIVRVDITLNGSYDDIQGGINETKKRLKDLREEGKIKPGAVRINNTWQVTKGYKDE